MGQLLGVLGPSLKVWLGIETCDRCGSAESAAESALSVLLEVRAPVGRLGFRVYGWVV